MTPANQTPSANTGGTLRQTLMALLVLIGVGIAFTGALAAGLVVFAN